jgi:hypothetical protein
MAGSLHVYDNYCQVGSLRMTELTLRKLEAKERTKVASLEVARDIALGIIRQPATGLILATVVLVQAQKANLLDQTTASILEGVILTSAGISAIGQAASGLVGVLK